MSDDYHHTDDTEDAQHDQAQHKDEMSKSGVLAGA